MVNVMLRWTELIRHLLFLLELYLGTCSLSMFYDALRAAVVARSAKSAFRIFNQLIGALSLLTAAFVLRVWDFAMSGRFVDAQDSIDEWLKAIIPEKITLGLAITVCVCCLYISIWSRFHPINSEPKIMEDKIDNIADNFNSSYAQDFEQRTEISPTSQPGDKQSHSTPIPSERRKDQADALPKAATFNDSHDLQRSEIGLIPGKTSLDKKSVAKVASWEDSDNLDVQMIDNVVSKPTLPNQNLGIATSNFNDTRATKDGLRDVSTPANRPFEHLKVLPLPEWDDIFSAGYGASDTSEDTTSSEDSRDVKDIAVEIYLTTSYWARDTDKATSLHHRAETLYLALCRLEVEWTTLEKAAVSSKRLMARQSAVHARQQAWKGCVNSWKAIDSINDPESERPRLQDFKNEQYDAILKLGKDSIERERTLVVSSGLVGPNFSPITKEQIEAVTKQQLAAEVKGIYAGLVMTDAKCISTPTPDERKDPPTRPGVGKLFTPGETRLHQRNIVSHRHGQREDATNGSGSKRAKRPISAAEKDRRREKQRKKRREARAAKAALKAGERPDIWDFAGVIDLFFNWVDKFTLERLPEYVDRLAADELTIVGQDADGSERVVYAGRGNALGGTELEDATSIPMSILCYD
jgi:hypothetical protein